MPSRGRRVAARQAQLSRRKRRDHGPASIPADQPRSPSPALEAVAPSPVAPVAGTVRSEARIATPPRRAEQRHPVYHYVGPEIRRIVILTGIIVIVLVVAAFLIK
jgi:hypothetical protein